MQIHVSKIEVLKETNHYLLLFRIGLILLPYSHCIKGFTQHMPKDDSLPRLGHRQLQIRTRAQTPLGTQEEIY